MAHLRMLLGYYIRPAKKITYETWKPNVTLFASFISWINAAPSVPEWDRALPNVIPIAVAAR